MNKFSALPPTKENFVMKDARNSTVQVIPHRYEKKCWIFCGKDGAISPVCPMLLTKVQARKLAKALLEFSKQ